MDFKKIIRYRTLDRCFRDRSRYYTIDDLFVAIQEAYTEYGFIKDIKIRQLRYDIQFMKSPEGWNIKLKERFRDGKKGLYRYENPTFSILNQPIHAIEKNYLQMAIYVLDRFKIQKGFEWVNELIPKIEQELMELGQKKRAIQFSQNLYIRGLHWIERIFEAIVDKIVLRIDYQPFNKDSRKLIFHPYLLKEYNNRWFLIGMNAEFENQLTTLALDRIIDIQELYDENYILSKFDLDEYFEDIIGVTRPTEGKLTTVELQFTKGRANYILTKPLHHSQKGTKQNPDGSLNIRLQLIPNRELTQTLLQFGADVKVISPLSLQKWMQEEIQKMLVLYSD